ncbi:BlaI/MecI/CopY family transcriptional regulator [Solimicrobium silvestre]|uniref:Putative transcriptional regulator n=1 Tax=Solimicrobium silvestre TaxID=2099400 RepID=A0A2S9GT58_9BURK|nr:BlaI/MecI/CopY family transcriptional regulator [Solimicrobium silvestre]PRC90900.1 putative transcriptional regulator [Solimicrobium silvestre]
MTITISEAESAVMKIFWDKNPLSCSDVVTALADEQDWQEPTVKTFLNRLLKKGALRSEKDGRRFLYWPVLTREQWLSSESDSMLKRLFGGQLAPFVAHFGAHKKLSKKEVAELKALIDRMSDEQ